MEKNFHTQVRGVLRATTSNDRVSLSQSYGTNLIPAFCKTYYENTGHKVIAVMAAKGGESIGNYLPFSDEDYADNEKRRIYEAMKEKYTKAIKCIEDNGFTIKNRYSVCFQGENDVGDRRSKDEYKRLFKKVTDNLKNDLEITNNVIIEPSHNIGNDLNIAIENIHNAQEELANENEDIIIGSKYSYERWIPKKSIYEQNSYVNTTYTDEQGNKLPYDEALELASLCRCYTDNRIHHTSAALCQIGKESAESLVKNIVEKIKVISDTVKTKYVINRDNLNMEEGKIQVTYLDGSAKAIGLADDKIEVNGFYNNELGKKVLNIKYAQNLTSYEVSILRFGDIDESNSIDPGDVLTIQRYIAIRNNEILKEKHKDWNLKDEYKNIGDLNENGDLDSGDTLKILRHIAAEKSEKIMTDHPDWLID